MTPPRHPAMRALDDWTQPLPRCQGCGIPTTEHDADNELLARIARHRTQRRLRASHRDALVLYGQGYSYRGVAELLRLNESTVRERIAAGLHTLDGLERSAA